MKKTIYILLFAFFLLTQTFAGENLLKVFKNSFKEKDADTCLKNGCKALQLDLDSDISREHLSIIHYILKNTYENNTHKMRGEQENKVYVKITGEEAVFDKDGNLVTNDWNKGSYNYGSYDKPVNKFEVDIWPWLIWGNTKNDPTSFEERFYHFLMDLNIGIQEYIFLDDKTVLENVEYLQLKELDRAVYHFFDYLLFNDSYKFDLSDNNVKIYKNSADDYWKYLSQLFDLAGY